MTTPEAIRHFFTHTGVDGAMIGRGALGNPWIFRQALQMAEGLPTENPPLEEKERTILRHLQMMVDSRGKVHGVKEFRKHLIWYTRGLRGSSDFRSRIVLLEDHSEMVGRIQEYFQSMRECDAGADLTHVDS